MKKIANPGEQGHKKKTYQDKIHKSQLPLALRKNAPAWAQMASMPTAEWNRQGEDSGEERTGRGAGKL
jgi:hypothetical protein